METTRRGITLIRPNASSPSLLKLRAPDGRELVLDGRIVVGSAPGSDLELRDPHVSGSHCAISREGDRTLLRDCGSANGTFLGALRVDVGELRAGLSLRVGRTTLRVVSTEGQPGRAEQAGNDGASIRMSADGQAVGRGAKMQELRWRIEQVATASASVLLLGESGTGKELAAKAVHAASGRSGKFVAVNCGALPSTLVESELFGHERGAFTGAVTRKEGLFAEADGGTLFFDEIAELPLALQPTLLRVLETRQVRPVGGNGERAVDVRVVAATHQDLAAAVVRGAFRLDLYHRLSIIELTLPPLRERTEDIAELARHFLAEMADDCGPRSLSQAALSSLRSHRWPGNVRELRNALQSALIFGSGDTIEAEDLPLTVRSPRIVVENAIAIAPHRVTNSSLQSHFPSLRSPVEVERETILEARRLHGTNRKAALALGMAKSTFCDKVRRYQARPEA